MSFRRTSDAIQPKREAPVALSVSRTNLDISPTCFTSNPNFLEFFIGKSRKNYVCLRNKGSSLPPPRRLSYVPYLRLNRRRCSGSVAYSIHMSSEDDSKHVAKLSTGPKLLLPFLVGSLAGFLGSLIGVGGGIILTPLLTGLMGLSQHQAHGTSLVAVSLSSIMGALAYYRGRAVDPLAALVVTIGAILTARFGAAYSRYVDGKRLRKYFGVFVIFAGVLTLFKGISYIRTPATTGSNANLVQFPDVSEARQLSRGLVMPLAVAGSIAGFLSGLMGIGGGTIVVPVLATIGGFSQQLAQGTALAAMVLPAITGATTHWKLGHVQTELLTGLLLGISLGSWLGGGVALRLPYVRLLQVSSLLFVLMGVRIVTTATPSRSKPPRAAS